MLAMSISGYSMRIEDMGMVYGFGINDYTRGTKDSEGNLKKEYRYWNRMLGRCYTERYQHSSYLGCKPSENFKHYSYFHDWCQNQVGFGEDGFELDKDLLLKGNKIYSEDTCVFIPSSLNKITTSSKAVRGEYPIGVTFDNRSNTYQARVNNGFGKRINIGSFKSESDAFMAYCKKKKEVCSTIANYWRNKIDPRAYEALMNYKVEITD